MAAVSTTPPPIQAPTAKEKKYDRQLRLWAAAGQRALEESSILLVIPDQGEHGSGSSVAGVEALKNLVLPGIGSFTIADTATVTEADLGINFFLEASSLGKSRAEECVRLLEELNPDVKGHVLLKGTDQWHEDKDILKPYNLIILCAPIPPQHLQYICTYAQEHSVPLIHLRSIGFYSTFSVQLPSEFPIVDTHPDPDSIQDLRLLAPWPELAAEVLALGDIKTLDDHDHGHIPYVILLLYYLEVWKVSHDGKPPDTFREKTQFRDLIRSGARTDNAEGGEENFDEAAAAVLKTITPPAVDSSCREMFEMNSCTNLNASSANFWIIASAVRSFYKSHSVLPLSGALPDMKARSSDYIKLQNIYRSKARKDVAEVLHTVRSTEKELQRTTSIPESEVDAFCKNAAHVKVVHGTALPELQLNSKSLASHLANEDSLVPIWAVLAAPSSPHDGSDSSPTFSDIATPDSPAATKLQEIVAEVARAGGGELHNISSVTGGMVAQEAIKIITRQYVPVDNTCIFDGIKGQAEVVRL